MNVKRWADNNRRRVGWYDGGTNLVFNTNRFRINQIKFANYYASFSILILIENANQCHLRRSLSDDYFKMNSSGERSEAEKTKIWKKIEKWQTLPKSFQVDSVSNDTVLLWALCIYKFNT